MKWFSGIDVVQKSNISVLVLTYNEEVNLPHCLRSVAISDDVVVLDSFSTDATVSIAEAHGATVLQRKFDNYASQRNYGLSHPFKYDWVLMLDADEMLSEELVEEIREIVSNHESEVTLYRMRRKDIFMGRWIKHSSGYPTWFGRLFRVGRVRVEREINEEYTTDGKVGLMKGHLLHYPFRKGIAYWFERHNRYSSMEAERIRNERMEAVPWKLFLSKDPANRRKAFKQFAYRMPCRPLLTFVYLYFVRLGILDGRAGFHFSMMRAFYEYMIDLKIIMAPQENKDVSKR